jgi:hypothetical protein
MLTNIPNGLDEIIATYGSIDDPAFYAKNIVKFELPYPLLYGGVPVNKAVCHRLAVDNLVQAFKNLQAAGFADQFKEFNGIYARRAIRGQPSHPSAHSWIWKPLIRKWARAKPTRSVQRGGCLMQS